MDTLFLNSVEIKDLTGYPQPARQIRWLRENQYPFEVGGDKKPKVLRGHVVSRLGGVIKQIDQEPKLHL